MTLVCIMPEHFVFINTNMSHSEFLDGLCQSCKIQIVHKPDLHTQ